MYLNRLFILISLVACAQSAFSVDPNKYSTYSQIASSILRDYYTFNPQFSDTILEQTAQALGPLEEYGILSISDTQTLGILSSAPDSLINKINDYIFGRRTQTYGGFLTLGSMLANPSSSEAIIKIRQNILKHLSNDPDLCKKIQEQIHHLGFVSRTLKTSNEQNMISFLNEDSQELPKEQRSLYFGNFFQKYNTNPAVLTTSIYLQNAWVVSRLLASVYIIVPMLGSLDQLFKVDLDALIPQTKIIFENTTATIYKNISQLKNILYNTMHPVAAFKQYHLKYKEKGHATAMFSTVGNYWLALSHTLPSYGGLAAHARGNLPGYKQIEDHIQLIRGYLQAFDTIVDSIKTVPSFNVLNQKAQAYKSTPNLSKNKYFITTDRISKTKR